MPAVKDFVRLKFDQIPKKLDDRAFWILNRVPKAIQMKSLIHLQLF